MAPGPMAPGLEAQDTEAVLRIVERDPRDEARQGLRPLVRLLPQQDYTRSLGLTAAGVSARVIMPRRYQDLQTHQQLQASNDLGPLYFTPPAPSGSRR